MDTSRPAKKIIVAFAAGLSLLLGAWGAAALEELARQTTAARVNHGHDVLMRLDDLALASQEAEAEVRHYFIDGDTAALSGADSAFAAARHAVDSLRALTTANPNQRERLGAVGPLLDELKVTVSFAGLPAIDAFRKLDRDDAAKKILALVGAMKHEEQRRLDGRADLEERNQQAGFVLLLVALTCSLALILLSAQWVAREFRFRGVAVRVLAANEAQYRQVVEMAGDMIVRADSEGRFTFCNQSVLSTLHYTSDEILGRGWLKLVSPEHRRRAQRFYARQAARRQKNTYLELPIIDGHGKERWVGQSVQLIQREGMIAGFQAIVRDITEKKKAEFELERSRNFVARIASTTPGILYVYDLSESRLIYTNHEAATTLGTPSIHMGEAHHFSDLAIHPEDQSMVRSHHAAMKLSRDGEVRRIEYRARHAEGRWIWLSLRETAFERGPDRIVRKVVGIAQDVTERKMAQDKLTWQANFDALTGLGNRHNFRARLEGALRHAALDGTTLSLCLFDIDQFKTINDHFGHAAGDEVLAEIGSIVRAELRANDFAARLGGDEFCFALPGADESEAVQVAERIRDRLNTLSFGLRSGSAFSVTATFGVADCREHADARDLLEAADQALYAAKDAGRNRVRVHAA